MFRDREEAVLSGVGADDGDDILELVCRKLGKSRDWRNIASKQYPGWSNRQREVGSGTRLRRRLDRA